MATIKAFRGVLYNKEKVKNAGAVVAPPYDIIPAKLQSELYRKHPYNVIRLELGKTGKGDTARNNRYTRARAAFDAWLGKGIMLRDEADSLYVYVQEYRDRGRPVRRIGFLGLMGFGGGNDAHPHENTLAAPKEDRLSLMRAVKANLSPIFVLFDDPRRNVAMLLERYIARERPTITVAWGPERHKIWRLSDPALIRKITATAGGSELFIADGHHRFETAKNFARELASTNASRDLAERARALMVYFVPSDEKMLTVMPAHRLPKDIGGLDCAAIIEKLAPYFTIRRVSTLSGLMRLLEKNAAKHIFGMYAGKKRYVALTLKDPRASDRVIKDKPLDWRRLDVAILHRFIFQHLLGIRDTDDNVEFVKDPKEAAAFVDARKFPVAFFLNPTKAAQVKRIAKLGERMPRKATYFYPKPLTGLVINKI